ncbi:PREDICTED: protein ERGIC-53-like [Priapulus caudatus]|uniref:Protein ERGIC-53-like n=1 Tax=Priapulus caudatus TaxID=37621 RepID=A0ABM1FAR4_PRICU|nr:PREDICTED: protein ERGIC-53-like [Priapulus caudatus]
MAGIAHICLFLISLAFILAQSADDPTKRFEYKYSFKGPFLAQKDGTVPFWGHGGHAIASEDQVRITPSIRSQKGYMWTNTPFQADHWEIEVTIRINGRGRIGADGMAIWFTEQKGVEGPVFGNNDQWRGLGVFMDSFDNDGQHNNPYVLAMINDGTKTYDHHSDGFSQQLGGCLRDFRNKPFPTKLKVTYYKNTLVVLYHNGLTNKPDDYELCLRADNVQLPTSGHFGVSAATGGLADDHDVLSFLTFTLIPPNEGINQDGFATDQERLRYQQEYQDYQQKLEQQKQDYRQQHPDKQQLDDWNVDDIFEARENRELRQIFDGQTQIHDTMRKLHHKLDAVLGRQESLMAMVSGLGGAVQPGVPHQGGGPPVMIDSIKRHEVDAIMTTQREAVNSIQQLRQAISDVQQRIPNVGGAGQPSDSGSLDSGHHQVLSEIREGVSVVKRDLSAMSQRGGAQCPPQPDMPNCLTPTYFFIMIAGHFFLLVGYFMYRNSQEAKAKKFF